MEFLKWVQRRATERVYSLSSLRVHSGGFFSEIRILMPRTIEKIEIALLKYPKYAHDPHNACDKNTRGHSWLLSTHADIILTFNYHRLEDIGLGHYAKLFEDNKITPSEISLLTESQLIEMGISVVGDRLAILEATQTFLRGLRNEERNNLVLAPFKDWRPMRLCGIFERKYTVTEAAIIIDDPNPCACRTNRDNVDVTSIVDIQMTQGCLLTRVKVITKDPSMPEFTIRLGHRKGRQVYGTIKNLWEEDQLKMGLKFGRSGKV